MKTKIHEAQLKVYRINSSFAQEGKSWRGTRVRCVLAVSAVDAMNVFFESNPNDEVSSINYVCPLDLATVDAISVFAPCFEFEKTEGAAP